MIIVVGAIYVYVQTDQAMTDEPSPDIEITAEDVVDLTFARDPEGLREFCKGYKVLGYDLALAAFDSTYDQVDPSAEEVFDEAISRC